MRRAFGVIIAGIAVGATIAAPQLAAAGNADVKPGQSEEIREVPGLLEATVSASYVSASLDVTIADLGFFYTHIGADCSGQYVYDDNPSADNKDNGDVSITCPFGTYVTGGDRITR